MTERPSDQAARDRFTYEWGVNFAVAANAGSGKTTAISERLAAISLSERGGELLARTAVVTYTKKAAAQIEQRARSVLLGRMADAGASDAAPLARLDRAFFGTIHSFCLLLARRHGSPLGIHLNPTIVEDRDDACWHEFLEQDPMTFASLGPGHVAAFLRHASLDVIFNLAQMLDRTTARRLRDRPPAPNPPAPSAAALDGILAATARKGAGADALARNKETAQAWLKAFSQGPERLPIPAAEGRAGKIDQLYRRFFAPLKRWLADTGAVLAAELALRYQEWRLDRGIQTYADQIETATSLLQDGAMLERIRAEEWRVILDEAQDADPKQFEVMVEIARPPGAKLGTWPGRGAPGPRPGHFCLVGDAQQGIYASRADIRNFVDHVEAFTSGDGSERLTFDVTFRVPRRIVRLLNGTLPEAFGVGRTFNFGLPPAEGAPAPFLQVPYEPLAPGPANIEGGAWRLPLTPARIVGTKLKADRRLADEARQVARFLKQGGPLSVGAADWGSICVIMPRTAWLPIIRDEFEAAGLKTALQMRRNRNGDNPVYAWLCGLLAVACDPDNTFEWVGVLREVFAVSDAVIAEAVRGGKALRWDEPEDYPDAVAEALGVLAPFIARVDDEGGSLGRFAQDLAAACGLGRRARLVDPEGGLEDELARLLAHADERGAEGAGPREWLRDLLAAIDGFRASGRPESEAVNLITSHSAKGLEWPVVIPIGLWRKAGYEREHGLRILSDGTERPLVVLDNEGVDEDTSESRDRERLREMVRLLYVTLTRSRTALVIPWAEPMGIETDSFAGLWDLDPSTLDPLPGEAGAGAPVPLAAAPAPEPAGAGPMETPARAPNLPKRVLPHQLSTAPDPIRALLHESGADGPPPVRDGPDPLDYGLWWHETVEGFPWEGAPEAVAVHGALALAQAADQGFEARGREEWERFLASEPCRLIRETRWARLAEAGILAPFRDGEWIDGVIDLILHDRAGREVWIVDWKTNRRNGAEDEAALLGRLAATYEGQLAAYGACASAFFPECRIRLWVYSTVAGAWSSVAGAR
jgi:ATP-dependent helicase/nuclease subunit A